MSGLLSRAADVLGRRGVATWAVILAVSVPLAFVASAGADTDEPSFDPGGRTFDIEERVDQVFEEPAVRSASFLVDRADGGDALEPAVLAAVAERSAAVLTDPTHAEHLVSAFDFDMGLEVDRVASVATDVAERLGGGLESASAADVDAALRDLLDPSSPRAGLRHSLAESATIGPDGDWSSPAFLLHVRYDVSTFDADGDDDERDRMAERWLRDVQADLGDDLTAGRLIGVGIDGLLTGEEQVTAGSPFIFLAVALIVLLVAVLLRSYWAAAIAAAAIGTSLVLYGSLVALVGISTGSSLIVFVVPMTLIAFGVDFFVHAADRARERQAERYNEDVASSYSAAIRAIGPALTLAAATSIAAFAANGIAGIEAIVQFGVAASIGLAASFAMLGLVAPRALLAVEPTRRPPASRRLARLLGWIACLLMALAAGIVVSIAAAAPSIGVVALIVFAAIFVVSPHAVRRRRATSTSQPAETSHDRERGSDTSLLIRAIEACARRRRITLAALTIVAAVGGVAATRVEAAFEVSDFFSTDSAFIVGLDRNDEHFGAVTGSPAYVYVEGDLTDPARLRSLADGIDELRVSDAALARTAEGELVLSPNALDVVTATLSSSTARERVEATQGVVLDADADGWPDDRDAAEAIFRSARADGVTTDAGATVFTPDTARLAVERVDDRYATRLQVIVTTFTDDDQILEARRDLERVAELLAADFDPGDSVVGVSGEVITSQESLSAFTRAMVVSLPVALVLTMLIVALALRSIRFALVSLFPILVVVVAVWGYMAIRGFTINVVTATIAAIAVGVGIDFCTHFTVRYRTELASDDDPVAAVRRSAAGTGGALAVSALTSVLGFGVMALAPAPIFSSFGELMAVMILFSAAAALFVLPSLLVLVTPRRRAVTWEPPTSRDADRDDAVTVPVAAGSR